MTMGLRFAFLFVALLGCAPAQPPRDAGRVFDSGLPDLTPSPDGMGFCCPPATPSCECRSTGGFVATVEECTRDFRRTCDLHPNDWIRGTDTHGCSAYRARSWSEPLTSCFPSPRRDAGFNGDADLPPGVTPAPVGPGYCCLPDAPSCACAFTGGFAETPAECIALQERVTCGVDPSRWVREVLGDVGCPFYTVVASDSGIDCSADASVDLDAADVDAGT